MVIAPAHGAGLVLRRIAFAGRWVAPLGAALLSGCSLLAMLGYEPGKTSDDASPSDPLSLAAQKLLDTDGAFSARSVEAGAAQAFSEYLDERSVQLPIQGAPIIGRDAIRERLASGPPLLLSWEPRYAEVFAPGDWGWSWGEWQAHEPGAGGRRLSVGKYVNIWKKQPDGSWKVRMDMGNQEK